MVRLSWHSPEYPNGGISKYTVELQQLGGSSEPQWVDTDSGAETSKVLGGLNASTGYQFRVRANSHVPGEWSQPVRVENLGDGEWGPQRHTWELSWARPPSCACSPLAAPPACAHNLALLPPLPLQGCMPDGSSPMPTPLSRDSRRAECPCKLPVRAQVGKGKSRRQREGERGPAHVLGAAEGWEGWWLAKIVYH